MHIHKCHQHMLLVVEALGREYLTYSTENTAQPIDGFAIFLPYRTEQGVSLERLSLANLRFMYLGTPMFDLANKVGQKGGFGNILISQGCHSKSSQMRWLNKTETYSLIVLQASSLKSGCQQVHSFWRLLGMICFKPLSLILVTADIPCHSLVCGYITSVSAYIFPLPSLCFCVLSTLSRT